MGAFFCTKIFYIVNTRTISFWVFSQPTFMELMAYISITYTMLLLTLLFLKHLIEKYTQRGLSLSIVKQLRSFATLLLFPFELSIYGIKSILVVTFSFESSYRDLFLNADGSRSFLYYFIFIAMYLDFVVSVIICYTKCNLLRPLIPNGGFFSKVDGNFE